MARRGIIHTVSEISQRVRDASMGKGFGNDPVSAGKIGRNLRDICGHKYHEGIWPPLLYHAGNIETIRTVREVNIYKCEVRIKIVGKILYVS
ncbi:hypothetical protein EDF58_12413 [Novosphingobium sp. PhB57]|nr:hypothetical protein EDF58_12413 [Novosphingobium sp. PhB57]